MKTLLSLITLLLLCVAIGAAQCDSCQQKSCPGDCSCYGGGAPGCNSACNQPYLTCGDDALAHSLIRYRGAEPAPKHSPLYRLVHAVIPHRKVRVLADAPHEPVIIIVDDTVVYYWGS